MLRAIRRHWIASSVVLVLVGAIGAWGLVEKNEPNKQQAEYAAKQPGEKEALDVLASERVAYYTKVLAIFTGIVGAFGVVQIGFLIRADRTAARTADTAEQAMISAQRAYLFAEGYSRLAETPPGAKGHHWRFRPKWRNSGDTPPDNLVIYTQCVISEEPLSPDYAFPSDVKDVASGMVSAKGETLGGQAPRQVLNEPCSAISPDAIALVQQGKMYLYLWGWAAYNDVFKGSKRHLTHFCWLCDPAGDPRSEDINALRWNYTQHTRGNYFKDL